MVPAGRGYNVGGSRATPSSDPRLVNNAREVASLLGKQMDPKGLRFDSFVHRSFSPSYPLGKISVHITDISTMHQNIQIINVLDCVNGATRTFSSYFTDEDKALDTIARLGQYWVAEHGGMYLGYVKDEDGYCVKKDEEIVLIYYIQTLVDFVTDNYVDPVI